jgi:hypothetical protein
VATGWFGEPIFPWMAGSGDGEDAQPAREDGTGAGGAAGAGGGVSR